MIDIGILLFILAFICQLVFLGVLLNNCIRRRSFSEWLLPGGTTRKERILLFVSFLLVICLAIAGVFWPR